MMAKALTRWYEQKITINPEHILFTVGGAGGIHTIFTVINKNNPGKKIIAPFPNYSLYATSAEKTKLHPIYVMRESAYRLTANALQKSINLATKGLKDKTVPKNGESNKTIDISEYVSAFLFNDPNNPL